VSYLLDTNVISEARRRGGDPGVVAWLSSVAQDELFVSALVVGEVRRRVERLRGRDPAQAGVFERWLAELRHRFGERIVAIDAEIADEWGRLTAADPLPVEDALMAATARVRGMVLVTRNVAHVERTGVALLNPWELSR
jgi:predicted nucleic acid-binding protein